MPRGRPKKVKPEVKTVYALTEEQIGAIKRANEAMFATTMAYRQVRHPSYDAVVNLDDAWCEFHAVFNEEIHND
jgi:hypothetical protein